jgi:phage terminase large subunit-like protein
VVTGSTFAALSADHRKAHGLSPVCYVADEVAQWRDAALLDALRTGQGAHAEPIGIVISTRSPDPANPLEELLQYGDQVAAGIFDDPTFFCRVWSAPLDADPWAEETWHAAIPGLGDIRSLEDVRTQAAMAKRLPSQEAAFRAYVLNQPTALDDRFLAPSDWDACGGTAEASGPVYGALDLSSGPADLTALALYWPETGLLRAWAFLPSAAIDAKAVEDRAPYAQWRAAGHVIEIPGRAIDRPWLAAWIAEKTEALDLQGIACDRWGLNDWNAVLDREGIRLPMEPHGQGYKDFSPSLSAFESAVLSGTLAHEANPLLRWAVSNAVIDMDPAGGRKVAKNRSRGRVDPLVAAVMAVGTASRAPAPADFSFTGMFIGS